MAVKRKSRIKIIFAALFTLFAILFVMFVVIIMQQQGRNLSGNIPQEVNISKQEFPQPLVNTQPGSLDADLIVNQQLSDYDLLSNENPLELPQTNP